MAVTILRKTSEDLITLATVINDLRLNAIGAGSKYHIAVPETIPTHAASTNLATAITLVNHLKRVYEGYTTYGFYLGHRNDAPSYEAIGMPGLIHAARDTANGISAADATNQATADTLADELKADFNAHLTQAGVHFTNDVANAVVAAGSDGTEGTLVTLANAIRTAMIAHMGDGLGGIAYRLVAP